MKSVYVFTYPGTNAVAFLDERALPQPTIRHSECALLLSEEDPVRCQRCDVYRRTLRVMTCRHRRSQEQAQNTSAPSSHTNYRYLSTPEKVDRLRRLHDDSRCLQKKLRRREDRIAALIAREGVSLDAETTDDLSTIMTEQNASIAQKYPPNSFQRVFWEQQKEASCGNRHGMRWHPAMIKWCLFLRHQSSKAYELLRDSGCIHLPSQRTLRDYSHCVKSEAGFSTAVDLLLMKANSMSSCPD